MSLLGWMLDLRDLQLGEDAARALRLLGRWLRLWLSLCLLGGGALGLGLSRADACLLLLLCLRLSLGQGLWYLKLGDEALSTCSQGRSCDTRRADERHFVSQTLFQSSSALEFQVPGFVRNTLLRGRV